MSSQNIAENVKKTNVGGIAAIVAVILIIFVAIGLSNMSQNSGTARISLNSDTDNVVNVSIGDTVTFGKENREWIVLDKEDEKALLLTKESVGERAYHVEWTDITWEDCTLREWLNEEFYHDSFTEAEKN